MADINEASIQRAVQAAVTNLSNDLKRVENQVSRLESAMHDFHTLQREIHQMISNIQQLQNQTRNLPPNLAQDIQQIHHAVEEVRIRSQHAEESSKYTAGYVALRLKERFDKQQ